MRIEDFTINGLRLGLSLVMTAGLVLGCRGVTPLQAGTAPSLVSTAAEPAGMGQAEIHVELPKYELPEFKLAQGDRRVQHVDWTIATRARLSFYSADTSFKPASGAAVNTESWTPIGALQTFVDVAGSMRRATFTNVELPAGKRRVVKVDLLETAGSTTPMHSLWGYGDITVGSTTTIKITPYTTPTARVFRDLLAVGDRELAMTVSATEVQRAVERLLDAKVDANFNFLAAEDRNLDGATAPIHPGLLDTQPLTEAIIAGTTDASGVVTPYRVPDLPFGPDLAVTPVRQATVTIKALDSNGQWLTKPSVVYVTDPVSPVQVSSDGLPVDQTFFPVATGNWKAAVIDTFTGRRIDAHLKPSIWHNETRELILSMPPAKALPVLGTFNEPGDSPSGYNGEDVHFSFFYAKNPRHLVVKELAGKQFVFFVDVGNKRIRYCELDNPDAIVKTLIGGDGAYGSIKVTEDSDLVFDAAGDLYFSEPAASVVSKVDILGAGADPARPAVYGAKTTVVDISTLGAAVWGASDQPAALAYNPDNNSLFVGSRMSETGGSLIEWPLPGGPATAVLTGTLASSRAAPLVSTNPALATAAAPPYAVGYKLPFGGGGLVYHRQGADRYLFYSGVATVKQDAGPTTTYPLVRHHLNSDTSTILAGNPEFLHQDPFYGLLEIVDYRYTGRAERFYQVRPSEHLTLDNQGNLYYHTRDPYNSGHVQLNTMFRVTNAWQSNRATYPWLVSWIDLRPLLGYKDYATTPYPNYKDRNALRYLPLSDHLLGIALGPVDPVTGLNDLYCTGQHTVKNPVGAGAVAAQGVFKVQLK